MYPSLGSCIQVGEVRAVIFEKVGVEDALPVKRRQVLAPLAVHVQLNRHRFAAGALNHPQPDSLRRRRHRPDQLARCLRFDLVNRDHPPIRKVEAGVGVGGIFDEHLILGGPWVLVVVGVLPAVIGVKQARRRTDDLPQVELHLFEQPHRVQVGVESLSRRQPQAGFGPRPPAQREGGDIPGRNRRKQHPPAARLKSETGDGHLRARVFPGP